MIGAFGFPKSEEFRVIPGSNGQNKSAGLSKTLLCCQDAPFNKVYCVAGEIRILHAACNCAFMNRKVMFLECGI